MADDGEPEVSPDAGPPATGARPDQRNTVPGVDVPDAPERREATGGKGDEAPQPGEKAPDDGAAREREDDRS